MPKRLIKLCGLDTISVWSVNESMVKWVVVNRIDPHNVSPLLKICVGGHFHSNRAWVHPFSKEMNSPGFQEEYFLRMGNWPKNRRHVNLVNAFDRVLSSRDVQYFKREVVLLDTSISEWHTVRLELHYL